MKNNYLRALNEKGNEKLRKIFLEKDFSEYQKNLKKLVPLQKRLQKIDSELLGPISQIEAFHDLYLCFCYETKQPLIVLDLLSNTITIFRREEGDYKADEDKVEVATFNLDKLCLFNEQTIITLRILALEKIQRYEFKKKELKKKNRSKQKSSYPSYNNISMDNGSLEHFLVLLVSNYKHISYANSDIQKAIENYQLINQFLNFAECNDGIKNSILENFVNDFSKYVINNIDEKLYEPSLDGLNELISIQNNCLNTFHENLSKEPKYNCLVEDYLTLSKTVLEYEKKLSNL